jgi:hypothetical protein
VRLVRGSCQRLTVIVTCHQGVGASQGAAGGAGQGAHRSVTRWMHSFSPPERLVSSDGSAADCHCHLSSRSRSVARRCGRSGTRSSPISHTMDAQPLYTQPSHLCASCAALSSDDRWLTVFVTCPCCHRSGVGASQGAAGGEGQGAQGQGAQEPLHAQDHLAGRHCGCPLLIHRCLCVAPSHLMSTISGQEPLHAQDHLAGRDC